MTMQICASQSTNFNKNSIPLDSSHISGYKFQ